MAYRSSISKSIWCLDDHSFKLRLVKKFIDYSFCIYQ